MAAVNLKRLIPQIIVAAIALHILYLILPWSSSNVIKSVPLGNYLYGTFDAKRHGAGVFRDLSLTSAQCLQAFPDLGKEIQASSERGPFELERLPSHINGHVQARITDGKLYIISTGPEQAHDWLRRRSSALHQIHRAILTSPEPLPDTLLTISIDDNPTNNSLTFSRRTHQSKGDNFWLMPHYAFWSWAMPYIGPLDEALTKIYSIELVRPFLEKINKTVWRGTQYFNPVFNAELRPNLLRVSKDKPWSDIQAFKQGDRSEENNNIIPIEDFCKYKYVVYTEGKTYSGRLAYHQACASVVLTPPFLFIQHLTHLVRPFYASTLTKSTVGKSPGLVQNPPGSNPSFPTSYPPETANMVFVNNDWTNLESTIAWLEDHPDAAERIAWNQRSLMVGRGYLSPAAQTCYWRALIRAWTETAKPKIWGANAWGQWQTEGIRWETFSVHGKLTWD